MRHGERILRLADVYKRQRLSFMGLPCPNLCTGGELAHGRNEFAVLEEMETIVEIVKSIAELVE